MPLYLLPLDPPYTVLSVAVSLSIFTFLVIVLSHLNSARTPQDCLLIHQFAPALSPLLRPPAYRVAVFHLKQSFVFLFQVGLPWWILHACILSSCRNCELGSRVFLCLLQKLHVPQRCLIPRLQFIPWSYSLNHEMFTFDQYLSRHSSSLLEGGSSVCPGWEITRIWEEIEWIPV